LQLELELGILPKNRKLSGAIIMTREDGVPPEVSGCQLKPKPELDRAMLTQEAAAIKESAWVPSPFSWMNLPVERAYSNNAPLPWSYPLVETVLTPQKPFNAFLEPI